MKTNLEKWTYYKSIIDARETTFINSEIKEIPKAFYDVSSNGTIIVKTITGMSYHNRKYFSFNKRPTKIDVDKIKQYAEETPVLTSDNIFFHYEKICFSYKTTGAISLPDSLLQFSSIIDAEAKSAEIKKIIEIEEALLQNGHTRCARCRKVVPNSEVVTSNIIGRGRKQVWNSWKNRYEDKACVTQTPMKFCSGTCAAHEQMANEG